MYKKNQDTCSSLPCTSTCRVQGNRYECTCEGMNLRRTHTPCSPRAAALRNTCCGATGEAAGECDGGAAEGAAAGGAGGHPHTTRTRCGGAYRCALLRAGCWLMDGRVWERVWGNGGNGANRQMCWSAARCSGGTTARLVPWRRWLVRRATLYGLNNKLQEEPNTAKMEPNFTMALLGGLAPQSPQPRTAHLAPRPRTAAQYSNVCSCFRARRPPPCVAHEWIGVAYAEMKQWCVPGPWVFSHCSASRLCRFIVLYL